MRPVTLFDLACLITLGLAGLVTVAGFAKNLGEAFLRTMGWG